MNIQSNSVNTDTEGDIESVRFNGVNLEKMQELSFPGDQENCP